MSTTSNQLTVEERVKLQIGNYVVAIAELQALLAAADARIAELEQAPANAPTNGGKVKAAQ